MSFRVVEEPNPIVGFLRSVNPSELEREALARGNWGSNLTNDMIEILVEKAKEWYHSGQ